MKGSLNRDNILESLLFILTFLKSGGHHKWVNFIEQIEHGIWAIIYILFTVYFGITTKTACLAIGNPWHTH